MPKHRRTRTRHSHRVPAWFEEPYLAGLLRDTVPAEVIARIRASLPAATPHGGAQRQNYAILQKSVAKLAAAGARIIIGSDTGLEDHPFGFAEQKELQMMAEAA